MKSKECVIKENPFRLADAVKIILLIIGLQVINVFVIGYIFGTGALKPPSPFFISAVYTAIYVVIFLTIYYYIRDKYHTNWKALGFCRFDFVKGFFADLGLLVLFLIATYGYQIILNLFKVKVPSQEKQFIHFFGTSAVSLVILFLITVIIAPIVEEAFFRGFLYQAIKSKFGVSSAIWASALIFGLFHFGFLVVLPLFVLIGIMLAYVFERYKSLGASIMLHAMNNFVSFLAIVYIARK